MKKQLLGALHLHTTHSHDGKMSLDQLASLLRGKGFDFIAVTEHSYDVDADSMAQLVEESGKLSTPDFLIIPGLEFRCHHTIDILGYGVPQVCDTEEPEEVIDHIHKHGGVAVWAHPTIKDYPADECWIRKLDGVEIWNYANEGKFLPQVRSLKYYHRLTGWNSRLQAFTGLDFHRPSAFAQMPTVVLADNNERAEILTALRTGRFQTRSRFFNTGSKAELSFPKKVCVYSIRYVLNLLRRVRDLFTR